MGWLEAFTGPNATEEEIEQCQKFNEMFKHTHIQKPVETPDYDYDNRNEDGSPRIKRGEAK